MYPVGDPADEDIIPDYLLIIRDVCIIISPCAKVVLLRKSHAVSHNKNDGGNYKRCKCDGYYFEGSAFVHLLEILEYGDVKKNSGEKQPHGQHGEQDIEQLSDYIEPKDLPSLHLLDYLLEVGIKSY